MTNLERYKDDLIKIKGVFAVDRNTRKIVECSTLDCVDCIFNKGNCFGGDKIEWLCKEHKEPILSDDELELINAIGKATDKEYKYLARQKGGKTTLFTNKPFINNYIYGYFYTTDNDFADISNKGSTLFENIKNESGVYDIENKCFIKEYESEE